MADKIEMSLDDIMKMSKKPRGRDGKKGGQSRKNKGDNKRRRGNNNYSVRPRLIRTLSRARGRGGISRRTTREDSKVSTRMQGFFEGFGSRKVAAAKAIIQVTKGPTKLIVSDLDFKVSDLDIQELFADFGSLKNAAIHHDNSGRSLGTAHVVFEKNDDAIRAMKRYNGVPLDGRPMSIQMTTSEIPSSTRTPVEKKVMVRTRGSRGAQPRGIIRGHGGISRGGATKTTNRGRNSNRTMRVQRKVLTVEELDAELVAYAMEK